MATIGRWKASERQTGKSWEVIGAARQPANYDRGSQEGTHTYTLNQLRSTWQELMRITKKDDSRIRRKLANRMKNSQRVLLEPGLSIDSPWHPKPDSNGSKDRTIGLEQPNILHIPIDINLPLSWSRYWLIRASKRIIFSSSSLTKNHESLTTLSPLLRAATEESLWATWLLEGDDADTRLARGLLAEMEGCWSKLQYFEEIEHGFTQSAETYLHHLQERAKEEFPSSFKYSKNGKKIVSLQGQSFPKISQLYLEKLPRFDKGNRDSNRSGVYGETSSPSHAIAGLTDGQPGTYESGQFIFEDRSNLHDEGRSIAPACIAFSEAVNRMHWHLGVDSNTESWILGIGDDLTEWCSLNGCES